MRILFLLFFLLSGKFVFLYGQVPNPKPSVAQLRWHNYERVMFIHYGPATWQGREYDNHTTLLERMQMPLLDTDQWCEVACLWGAKMILFVAKHCGGFCWWQTKTSDYGIKETPWKRGKGDVLKDLSRSCKKYGLDLGVYIYPGDERWGAGIGSGGITADPNKQSIYNSIFRTQLIEVLTKYGTISEVWFDGNCRIDVKDILEKYAKDAVIFQSEKANLRWVGNEDGYAPYPNWYTVCGKDLRTGVSTALHSDLYGDCYAPVEVDVPLLKNGGHKWFWAPGCDSLLMTQKQLMELYYKSVGRGAVLLLNATPDTTGVIPSSHVSVYKAFGQEITRRFSVPLKETRGRGYLMELDFGNLVAVNHCVIQEDLSMGQNVVGYQLEECMDDGEWKTFLKGSSVGHQKIDFFPSRFMRKLRLRITDAKNFPLISRFSAYYVADNEVSLQNMFSEEYQIGTWNEKTFNADNWRLFTFDLTSYITQIGEYEICFNPLATDYLNCEISTLEFKDIELFMYGSKVKAEGILSFLSDRNAFRITRSQQTIE